VRAGLRLADVVEDVSLACVDSDLLVSAAAGGAEFAGPPILAITTGLEPLPVPQTTRNGALGAACWLQSPARLRSIGGHGSMSAIAWFERKDGAQGWTTSLGPSEKSWTDAEKMDGKARCDERIGLTPGIERKKLRAMLLSEEMHD